MTSGLRNTYTFTCTYWYATYKTVHDQSRIMEYDPYEDVKNSHESTRIFLGIQGNN